MNYFFLKKASQIYGIVFKEDEWAMLSKFALWFAYQTLNGCQLMLMKTFSKHLPQVDFDCIMSHMLCSGA